MWVDCMESFSLFEKLEKREEKPRQLGITVVEDIFQYSDFELGKLLKYVGGYIDIVKFSAISPLLVDIDNVKSRLSIYKENNIITCLGGSMIELAYAHDLVDVLLTEVETLNIDMIELSFSGAFATDGNTKKIIRQINKDRLKFLVEVGYKNPDADLGISFEDRLNEIKKAIDLGAFKVVIEGRNGNFLYNRSGFMRKENIRKIIDSVNATNILFELPPLTPAVEVISDYVNIVGSDVNLGNVILNRVMIVEMFRRKWRGR